MPREQRFSHQTNLQTLINTPLCLMPDMAQSLQGHIEHGNFDLLLSHYDIKVEAESFQVTGDRERERSGQNIMMIPIHGTTAQRGDYWDIGYDQIKELVMFGLREEQIDGIMIDFSTSGGAEPGLHDFSRWLHKAAQLKPIVGMVNELCCSAGYYMASGLTSLYATESAAVGSIGVMVKHVDLSKMHEQEGIKVTMIASGAMKTLGNPYETLSETAYNALSAGVMSSAQRFFEHVAPMRNIEIDVIKNMEAGVVDSKTGLQLGLIDQIMSVDDAIMHFAESLKTDDVSSISLEGMSLSKGNAKGADATKQAEASGSETEKTFEEGLEQGRQEAASSENERIMGILDLPEAKGREALARHLAKRGESVEDAKAMLAVAPDGEASTSTSDSDDGDDDELGNTMNSSTEVKKANGVRGDTDGKVEGSGKETLSERKASAATSVTSLLKGKL